LFIIYAILYAPNPSYGNTVSEIKVQVLDNNWKVFRILVVVTLGAETVAVLIATFVTAGAVPVGVLNVAVL